MRVEITSYEPISPKGTHVYTVTVEKWTDESSEAKADSSAFPVFKTKLEASMVTGHTYKG